MENQTEVKNQNKAVKEIKISNFDFAPQYWGKKFKTAEDALNAIKTGLTVADITILPDTVNRMGRKMDEATEDMVNWLKKAKNPIEEAGKRVIYVGIAEIQKEFVAFATDGTTRLKAIHKIAAEANSRIDINSFLNKSWVEYDPLATDDLLELAKKQNTYNAGGKVTTKGDYARYLLGMFAKGAEPKNLINKTPLEDIKVKALFVTFESEKNIISILGGTINTKISENGFTYSVSENDAIVTKTAERLNAWAEYLQDKLGGYGFENIANLYAKFSIEYNKTPDAPATPASPDPATPETKPAAFDAKKLPLELKSKIFATGAEIKVNIPAAAAGVDLDKAELVWEIEPKTADVSSPNIAEVYVQNCAEKSEYTLKIWVKTPKESEMFRTEYKFTTKEGKAIPTKECWLEPAEDYLCVYFNTESDSYKTFVKTNGAKIELSYLTTENVAGSIKNDSTQKLIVNELGAYFKVKIGYATKVYDVRVCILGKIFTFKSFSTKPQSKESEFNAAIVGTTGKLRELCKAIYEKKDKLIIGQLANEVESLIKAKK